MANIHLASREYLDVLCDVILAGDANFSDLSEQFWADTGEIIGAQGINWKEANS